jgi:uncharacterized protein YjcR
MSNTERDDKKRQGFDMYAAGISEQIISETLEVNINTVYRWKKEGDWENRRKVNQLTMGEIRKSIIDSWDDLKNGKKPAITPDMASKYAAAFERFSDKRKTLSYMFEIFEMFTTELLLDVQNAKTDKQRDDLLSFAKRVRAKLEQVTSKMYKEVLDDE